MAHYTSLKPDVNGLNAGFRAEAQRIKEGIPKYIDDAQKRILRLELLAACEHDFEEKWDRSSDGHRFDYEQYWVCKKCKYSTLR